MYAGVCMYAGVYVCRCVYACRTVCMRAGVCMYKLEDNFTCSCSGSIHLVSETESLTRTQDLPLRGDCLDSELQEFICLC